MNLIRFIKRIFNLGGPRIDLVTRDSEYYPSEWIKGELFITAPDYRQEIESITINLKEFWVEYLTVSGNRSNRAARYQQHGSIAIAGDFVFLPRMKYQFPFEIQLPANCRVSSEESGWRLGVVISAFRSSVARADFNVSVRLSKGLQEIIKAIEKNTKFIEVPRGRKFIPDTCATRFVFRPPENHQSDLQYFMLDVSLTEKGGIKGNFLFSMSESGSFSQFNDSGENFPHEFQIEPTQSVDSRGQVDGRAIAYVLSDKIRQALDSRSKS